MAITLNGTTGIVGPNGTASAPAMTGTDSDTGIVYGTNTVSIATGGTTAVTVDSSQNVGIGTSSPNAKISFGTSSVDANGYDITGIRLYESGGTIYGFGVSGNQLNSRSPSSHVWYTATTERMRIDSNGNLLLGTTSFQGGATRGFQINATGTSSSNYAQLIKNGDGTEIFQMRNNGGLGNYSANNANLSDERVKTNIELAGSYLDKICAIPVKTFKYKNQTDDLLNLGVIAQDVETVAPELVDVGGFGDTPEDGIPLKAIYQTDLQYALMKCIQEQQAIITDLKARIETLENK